MAEHLGHERRPDDRAQTVEAGDRALQLAQGELQGAVAGLYSLSSIIGPPLMTQVFGHFSARSAGVYFPGAAFLTAALLTVGSALLFARAMRFAPQRAPAPSSNTPGV